MGVSCWKSLHYVPKEPVRQSSICESTKPFCIQKSTIILLATFVSSSHGNIYSQVARDVCLILVFCLSYNSLLPPVVCLIIVSYPVMLVLYLSLTSCCLSYICLTFILYLSPFGNTFESKVEYLLSSCRCC